MYLAGCEGLAHPQLYAGPDKLFLGLSSYYKKFVKWSSCIAAPLFRLLQKGETFMWNEECGAEFTSLQTALVESSRLSPSDPALSFILDANTSSGGSRAVVAQMTPEGERVVLYHSWIFSRAEHHDCATKREQLAEVSTIWYFKYYLSTSLSGLTIQTCSDSCPSKSRKASWYTGLKSCRLHCGPQTRYTTWKCRWHANVSQTDRMPSSNSFQSAAPWKE